MRSTSQHDGARLAYTSFGKGPVLLQVPRWAHCIEWMSKEPEIGEFYEKLARRHRVVILERRGTGASQRDVTDYSMAAHVGDLRSLVEHLRLDRFALFGAGDSGGVCITYAVRHPDEVSHLILWGTYAGSYGPMSDRQPMRQVEYDLANSTSTYNKARAELFLHAWDAAARLTAAGIWPSGPIDTQLRAAKLWSGWMPAKVAHEYLVFSGNMDVLAQLPMVAASTLVMHRKVEGGHPIELSREIASIIPNSRFVSIDGDIGIAEMDHEQVLAAIEGFLAGRDAVRINEKQPGGTAVILFADIADSTGITERIGDAAFHAMSEGLHRALREALASAGGRVVEGRVLGDGVMAVFDAAKDAIAAAGAAHGAAEAAQLQLHIGIHAGDVIRDANDVHGGAVNMAARVAAASAAGETLVSDVVRALGRTSAGVVFEDRGEFALKGIEDPQRLFAVRRGNS